MVGEIIKQNTYGYPMIMTVSLKHELENPKVFEAIGFKTYLNLSGFAYMVYGELEDVRMKILAHITMTNVWNSTKGDWLKMKHSQTVHFSIYQLFDNHKQSGEIVHCQKC